MQWKLPPFKMMADFQGCFLCPSTQAGHINPAVRLSVVNLVGAPHTQELQPPDQLALRWGDAQTCRRRSATKSPIWSSSLLLLGRDFYVTMVKWISNTHLAVRWLNRPQNASLLTVCDATIGVCLQVGALFEMSGWKLSAVFHCPQRLLKSIWHRDSPPKHCSVI